MFGSPFGIIVGLTFGSTFLHRVDLTLCLVLFGPCEDSKKIALAVNDMHTKAKTASNRHQDNKHGMNETISDK